MFCRTEGVSLGATACSVGVNAYYVGVKECLHIDDLKE